MTEMAEALTVDAVKEILATMIHSHENIQINREMQKTERTRIEAQKEVLIEGLRGKHEQNMRIIHCTSQERKQLIHEIGEIIQKENLNENDVTICQLLLSTLSLGQQSVSNALASPPFLQLN